MRVGVAPVFQSIGYGRPDFELYQQELAIADLAEPLGFDSVWTTEHHFTDYQMIPSPTQFLTYMAGRTKRIRLGSMVVVVPWHDPLRVAEEVALLENLSGGRTIFGLGRGLARIEFDGFRVPMEESRPRFAECSHAILDSLETGWFELDGEYAKVPRCAIRPRPIGSFRGRTYVAGLSPETPGFAVDIGAGLLQIPALSWDEVITNAKEHERVWAAERPGEPRPRPLVVAFTYVDRDPARAEAVAMQYMPAYMDSVLDHYDFRQAIFGKEYSHYQGAADTARSDPNQLLTNFARQMVWGTPDQTLERIMDLRAKIDPSTVICHFSYAGMPYELAQRSMRLFAEEVLPVVHAWNVSSHVPAADPQEAALAAASDRRAG